MLCCIIEEKENRAKIASMNLLGYRAIRNMFHQASHGKLQPDLSLEPQLRLGDASFTYNQIIQSRRATKNYK